MLEEKSYHELRRYNEWHRALVVGEKNAIKKKDQAKESFSPYSPKSNDYFWEIFKKSIRRNS